MKPCPDVAGSYQLPLSPKSALSPAVDPHSMFVVSRVSGIVPERPLPSVSWYASEPLVHVLNEIVAVPTAVAEVIGAASKLPPTLRYSVSAAAPGVADTVPAMLSQRCFVSL